CTLRIGTEEDGGNRAVLEPAAVEGLRALADQVKHAFPDARPLSVLEVLRWPGVLMERRLDASELAEPAKEALRDAAAALEAAREREGVRLAALLEERLDGILALLESVRPRIEGVQ